MKAVIQCAIDTIDETLDTNCYDNNIDELYDIQIIFEDLLEAYDSKENQFTRLFCRQLNRLMTVDGSLSVDFWIKLREDILYAFGERDSSQMIGSGRRFLKRMKFEEILEQRELNYRNKLKEQKSLQQFVNEYKQFFDVYLRNCILFHSKMQITNLFDDMNSFYEDYNLDKDDCNVKKLEDRLRCIEVEYDCNNRSFYSVNCDCLTDHYSYKRITTNLNNFLPSEDQLNTFQTPLSVKIDELLRHNRWIVILSDPGNSKTTLLRWLTHLFAKATITNSEFVKFEGDSFSVETSVRIPILIRIVEFTAWLKQDPTKTLMDYIGQHTWLGKPYSRCDDTNGQILQELIYQGHALILLDGLDEIFDIQQRQMIVNHVEDFIKEYVLSSDFISAFDEILFSNDSILNRKVIETQPPNKSAGNQIIITSRIIGYQFSPLMGPFIEHSLLALIEHDKAMQLGETWIENISQGVFRILVDEEIQFNMNDLKRISSRQKYAIVSTFACKAKLFLSNSSLIFLICTLYFQSREELVCRSRVEIYDRAVETVLHSWSKQNVNIPETILKQFLSQLAFYLHSFSSSGLIDEFDINHLCFCSLQTQYPSRNRKELKKDADNIVSLLKLNMGIISERGLQVFGFLHLSFQEYFVALGLANRNENSSVEKVSQRILSFAVRSRFRESIHLAMDLISCQWSIDDYEKFCSSLITETIDYSIPLGILLLFDSIRDLYKLPSQELMIYALNNLFNHSCQFFSRSYFIPNLLRLPENIIDLWLNYCFYDETYFTKFYQLFLNHYDLYSNQSLLANSYIPSLIYEKLWSSHNRSLSNEFFVDQILRRTIRSSHARFFNKAFYSQAQSLLNIHPLIISVVQGSIGEICYFSDTQTIDFNLSLRFLHRECSILPLILNYLNDFEQSDSIKIENLIQQIQIKLDNSPTSDISSDIIDTFVALICLQGVSQPSIYQKYAKYTALPLSLDRFKRTWFYLKRCFNNENSTFHLDSDDFSMKSDLESIMDFFFPEENRNSTEYDSFSIACASTWKKFGIWDLINQYKTNYKSSYCECQPEFNHFPMIKRLPNIVQHMSAIEMLQNNSIVLLSFLPHSLQKLFFYATFSRPTASLSVIVFLSQCLTNLEDVSQRNFYSYLAFPILYPLLKKTNLENYISVLFREKYAWMHFSNDEQKEFFLTMRDKGLFDYFYDNRLDNYDELIEIERQRIVETSNIEQNSERDRRIFSASICLIRILQSKYRSCRRINLHLTENQDILSTIRQISNPILQITAFNIVLNMKDPFIFDEKQRDNLRNENIALLFSLLPHLSLTISTILFIQSQTMYGYFPELFQEIIMIIGEKLNQNFDENNQEQEAAYIALKQSNMKSDLSQYLFQFEKRARNLSEILQFNSTLFHQYITRTTPFESLNRGLLSSMYLIELAFDCQILRMYTENNQQNSLNLKQMWKDILKTEKIMTFRAVTWINNYLEINNQKELQQIIDDVSQCLKIEQNALQVVEKWLQYRAEKNLHFFAQYAALQLIIHGSTMSSLIDIVNEMFTLTRDGKYRLQNLIEHLFDSPFINSNSFHDILILLHRNKSCAVKIRASIDRQDLFEILLDLEFQRSIEDNTRSFLLLINYISHDLQIYLRQFIDTKMKSENINKQIYIIIVLKRFIEITIYDSMMENYSEDLYEYIVSLLNDQLNPQIQKAILNSLCSIFLSWRINQENIFFRDQTCIQLEKMILSWNTYTEDVVDMTLLTYGNYLLSSQGLQVSRNVSDEIKDTLKSLFYQKQSIRAGICFVLTENSVRDRLYITIMEWFDNNGYKTYEQKYKILLQLTLYLIITWSNIKYEDKDEYMIDFHIRCDYKSKKNNEVCNYLETHSNILISIFVNDLYDYLCKNNYLSDLTPNYIDMALKYTDKNKGLFFNAIIPSTFDEFKCRAQIYSYYHQNPSHHEISIKLYHIFGILTVEILSMLDEFYDENGKDSFHFSVSDLEKVSDRNTIEKLFQLIESTNSLEKLNVYLNILSSIQGYDQVSLIDIFKNIKFDNNVSYNYDQEQQYENKIKHLLLHCSCINSNGLQFNNAKLFTKNDIDEEYQKELEDIDKNPNLFAQRNCYPDDDVDA